MALPSTKKWFLYPSARSALRAGDIDLDADSFKAMLLSGSHTFSAGHTQRSDVAANALGTDQAVTMSVSLSNGLYTVSLDSSPSWSGGVAPRYVAIYDDTDANDALLGIYDNGAAQTVPSGWTFDVATGTVAVSNTNTSAPPVSGINPVIPNEPAGMTQIAFADGTVYKGDQSGSGGDAAACFDLPNGYHWYYGDPDLRMSVIADSNNPTGSGKAIRMEWPNSQPAQTRIDFGAALGDGTSYRNSYISYIFKLESGFCAANTGYKFWYLSLINAAGSDRMHPDQITDDHIYVTPGGYTSTGSLFADNTLYNLEVYTTAPSTPSATDGSFSIWLNGTLVLQRTSDCWTTLFASSPCKWKNIALFHMNSFSDSGTYYSRLYQLYLSGKD